VRNVFEIVGFAAVALLLFGLTVLAFGA